MPEHDARQRFYLDIPYRLTLMLSEVAHLLLCELDVVDGAGREFCDAIADLFVGQAKVVAIPFVEPDRVVANGSVAAQADIGENALDGASYPGIGISLRGRIHPTLKPTRHLRPPNSLMRLYAHSMDVDDPTELT